MSIDEKRNPDHVDPSIVNFDETLKGKKFVNSRTVLLRRDFYVMIHLVDEEYKGALKHQNLYIGWSSGSY